MKPTPVIRLVLPADLSRIAELSVLHAEFERNPLPVLTADSSARREKALGEMFFAPNPAMSCLVVQFGEALEGYATFGKQYSTWQARSYLYLDCLFLTPRVRGLGIGRSMMQRIHDEAVASGMSEIQWQTPQFNDDAIRFCEQLGAVSKAKQRFFWKVTDDSSCFASDEAGHLRCELGF